MGQINISDIDVVRAWKDNEYRNSLSEQQRASLPQNPAGEIDLADLNPEQIAGVRGGQYPLYTEGRCLTFAGTPSQCGGGCVSGYTKTYAGCPPTSPQIYQA